MKISADKTFSMTATRKEPLLYFSLRSIREIAHVSCAAAAAAESRSNWVSGKLLARQRTRTGPRDVTRAHAHGIDGRKEEGNFSKCPTAATAAHT